MKTFPREVTIKVQVTVDESKFDSQFMEEFRNQFYKFDDLDAHIDHLAQLFARGLASNYTFIEGYGRPREMGISFKQIKIYVDHA